MGEARLNDRQAMDNNDEIDLVQLFRDLWQGRWIIAGTTAICLLLGVLYLHNATYRFTASLTVAPARQSGGSLSRLGGLGSMASLAGINLPQDPGAQGFLFFSQGLHSRRLADSLARDQEVLTRLFPGEWDESAKTWREPSGTLVTPRRFLKALLGVPDYPWTAPDGARLQEYLKKGIRTTTDSDTSFLTIEFDHQNPVFAARFVDRVAAAMDDIVRQKTLRDSEENIAYLTQQLDRVTIVEQRLAIVQTMTEQVKQQMAARASAPFAADPIGAAAASIRPTSPRPVIVLAGALVGGIVIGSTITLAVLWARRRREI